MIKNYKQYNERLLDKMVGPTPQEVWVNMDGLDFYKTIPKTPSEFLDKVINKSKVSTDEYNTTYKFNDKLTIILNTKKNDIFYIDEKIIDIIRVFYLNTLKELNVKQISHWTTIENFFKDYFYKKENKQNESLLDKLKGPSDKEILSHLNKLNDSDRIELIIKNNLNYNHLPDNLVIDNALYCGNNQLTSLPDNLVVKGNLDCNDNQLTSLPDNLIVKGDLYCSRNQLTSLPDNLIVDGFLYCNNNQLTSLPDKLNVKGDLNCSNNRLTYLPDNLIINGFLYCNYNELTSLPDNLVVKGNLDCRNNKVKLEIPKTINVGGKIYN